MKTAKLPVYGNVAMSVYKIMLRIRLFSISTIKTPQALATFTPLDHLIVKTLTNVL